MTRRKSRRRRGEGGQKRRKRRRSWEGTTSANGSETDRVRVNRKLSIVSIEGDPLREETGYEPKPWVEYKGSGSTNGTNIVKVWEMSGERGFLYKSLENR